MKKHIPLAIVYDFDGTLAPGNMQERDFIPAIGMTKDSFWRQVGEKSKKHQADNILIYMKCMLDEAKKEEVQVRKENFQDYGKSLHFFDGVLPYDGENGEKEKGWFDRINIYGKQSGVSVNHFIVSSGIREMVTGTPIAKYFKKIYASSFCYDYHGVADWPALALNYTTKTQYLFRINKGCLNVYEHSDINEKIPGDDRAVPFSQIVYIGDGFTDVPCFQLVKDRGGYAIAVYQPHTSKKHSNKLFSDGRINFISPADYRDGRLLDRIIKGIIDKISFDSEVQKLFPK